MENALPRIFVQIASYRDAECHHTLTDLFEKAAKPERVFAGVCWQYDPKEDAAHIAVPYPRREQVRVIQYHVNEARGAGWARMQAQTLYGGEEYLLQIQAHHRFEPGWDDTLIAMLNACPEEKAALTAWLPAYFPPDRKPALNGHLPVACVNRFGADGDAQMLHLIKRMRPAEEMQKQLLPTPFWVGNFLFARAQIMKDVPFDPHIFFWGEEINYSARLWTHGYNLYHLNRLVAYHYWDREVKSTQPFRDFTIPENRRSLMRNRHLLGLEPAGDPQALVELDKFALGRERSLESFWKFAGVDLARRTFGAVAREGRWTKAMRDGAAQAKPAKPRIFVATAAYRDPEISHTLADMFAKAADPQRIRVGVCLQYDPLEDAHCGVTSDRMEQIRLHTLHYTESKGANWARHIALGLRGDEEYVLHIDSHMRFEPGWDETLIAMLERCPSDKPVITAYLPNYEPPDQRDYTPGMLLRIRVRMFGKPSDPQLLHITGQFVPRSDEERNGLYPTPLVIANFMFTKAKTFDEVPIDPHFHFYGDEISYSARLWTHGYDLFQPDRIVLFHYWVRKETLHLQHYRNTRTDKSRRSFLRVQHLLCMQRTDDAQALAEIDRYGLGAARSLDDLWAFVGVDWNKREIAQGALEGKWNMAARKPVSNKQKAVASNDRKPRIFVQIAAYRDPDCQWTVKDMFEKATHPERIFAGIVWQTVKGEDDICFQEPYPRPENVRVKEIDAKQSRGVCWARHMTQSLWEGEEFTLQIDSHMRFEPGWDETLLSMWKDCENERAVLTCYPPGFTPPRELQDGWIFGMSAKEFDKHGIFLMKGAPAYRKGQFPDKPMPGAFLSCCMYFGPASIIKDVPYDPHLYFFGEEISLAVRLWTHGYDIFYPNKLFIYHDWDRGKRPTHFSDHRDWGKLNEISFTRVKHMLGTAKTDMPEALKELDKYGLGKARSLAEYQEFSGVDFASQTFNERAAKGDFSPLKKTQTPAQPVKNERPRIFVQIASYRDRECQWTVKDLFEKAAHPDRVTVGICWQFDPEEDKDCFEVTTRPEQVRMIPVDWREAEGVCWARNLTQQMWEGEEYTLQIDSHMRFVPGWDELMIEELKACASAKPVLSCSPASYVPPNALEQNPHPTVRRVIPFLPDGNIRGKGEALHRTPDKPLNGAFIAAGFVFARSDIIKEVPYDPYLYFDQEEITYAARLYTHGWDVFSTRRPLLYHYYNIGGRDTARPLHWQDLRKENETKIRFLKNRGLKRFNHLTGYKASDDLEAIKELAHYGFGRARTLEQFESYSGVDFKRKIASEKALRCQFIIDLAKYRDGAIYVPELDAPQAQNGQKPAVLRPQQQRPSMAPVANPLEPGDFVPLFSMEDTNLRSHNLETHGGKHGIIMFMPAGNPEYVTNFLHQLHQRLTAGEKLDAWLLFILDDTKENLVRFKDKHKLPQVLTADPDRIIARAFGIYKPGELSTPPTGFVLNNNLQIVSRKGSMSASQLAEALVKDCREELARYHAKNSEQKIITQLPPVLIVPNVFGKELCERCIRSFETGHTFDGTVGAEAKTSYVPGVKVRTDHVLSGELLREVDDKLSRSLFPEVKKVFGFDITHREYYKVGLYSGENGGFFRPHRDNFDAPIGYRRVAMTLHLNDDYEGGGLRFPEYDEHIYRPEKGSAIVFSCATMHEARPVTKGKRFVVVGFFHGAEEEAYRRYYQSAKGAALKVEDFTPAIRQYPEDLELGRKFYADWQASHVHYGDQAKPMAQAGQSNVLSMTGSSMSNKPTQETPNLMINKIGNHQPRKVFESREAIVIDDFLPEDVFERVHAFCVKTDYEYINTKGKVSRAWHVHDGFPLRSSLNLFYYPEGIQKPQGDYVYPTKTDMDIFMDQLLAIQPQVEHFTGKMGKDWAHLTATAWIYPHGTGLSMHDDGSGVYSGAYVYFLNKQWKLHWGGLLLMIDEGNKAVYEYRSKNDQLDFYYRKWLNANATDDLLMEHGFAKCIFPKRNRIVFIANDAYHMVTRVNEQCGDNLRMSIAGFYNRKK